MTYRRISRARRGVQIVAIASSVLAAACLQSTAPQPSVIQLAGKWKYTGEQLQPVPRETLTGELTITSESGASFRGQLQLITTNEQTNETLVLNGPISGSESQSGIVDFDADLETVRQHFGQIVADTITGTWIGPASNGNTSSGTFRIERETQ
jgi:outer membrane biogenesis lipoprotein LolB